MPTQGDMIIHSDCILAMAEMEPSSVDAIVTDAPYGLFFMGAEWDATESPAHYQVWVTQWASEALRVLKPGGSLLSFGGTRTFHRLTCGLEDAGFTIKDCLMYLYGAGFPKAQDAANMIRKRYCRCGEQETEHDLRPVRGSDIPQSFDASNESGEVLFAGLQEQGASTRGIEAGNGDAGVAESSMEGRRDVLQTEGQLQGYPVCAGSQVGVADGEERRLHNGTSLGDGEDHAAIAGAVRGRASSRPEPDKQRPDESRTLAIELGAQESGVGQVCPDCGKPICPDGLAEYWDGYKVGGLKPAFEPIVFAVKPPEGAMIDNVLRFKTGAVNVDECRVSGEAWARDCRSQNMIVNCYGEREGIEKESHPKGRFPANLLLSHTPGCREVGTKRVKSPGMKLADEYQEGFNDTGAVFEGGLNKARSHGYADADGLETVEAWECAEDCPVRLLDEQSGACGGKWGKQGDSPGGSLYGWDKGGAESSETFIGDTGGPSRFFYTSKAQNRDSYNDHPTLKPTDLIEWLIRLVTRPGQTVLDPFAGSGTTGVAAIQSGREFILVEQDSHYCDICERRTTDGAQQGMF